MSNQNSNEPQVPKKERTPGARMLGCGGAATFLLTLPVGFFVLAMAPVGSWTWDTQIVKGGGWLVFTVLLAPGPIFALWGLIKMFIASKDNK